MSRRSRLAQAKISRGALYLLIATVVPSVVFLLASRAIQADLAHALAATGDSMWHGLRLWQIVSSPLLDPDLISLFFTGLMLWMFLPTLERWWGMKKFLLFALYTSVAGVVGGTLVGLALGGAHAVQPVSGLGPFTFAGMLAFGVLYAAHPVQLFGAVTMTGRQVAIGITAVALAFILIGQAWVQGSAQAAAMLVAFAITSKRLHLRRRWREWRQRRVRRRFGVIEGGKPARGRDKRWLN